jgi:hypothetical protein|tara:strand:- start:434 stop:844 length:411 start_codon:yes stop_codon:yes gene_type:complete
MTYNIELSLKLKQQSNITTTINNIIEESYNFSCIDHYVNYEYIYKKKVIIRNNCIISLTFDDNQRDISKFIRKIKKNRRIKIECVSYEDTIINLLYASKQYLNIMEKSQMKDYLEKKKNGLLDNDSLIMVEINKKS